MSSGVRVAVFSQPRSGTHFITRSLARSAQAPYCVDVRYGARYDIPVNSPYWIIASHNQYTDEIASRLSQAGAAVVGITRNPLDHVLSLLGHNSTIIERDILAIIEEGWISNIRRRMFAVPEERRVSYDILADPDADGHDEELARLENLTGIKSVTLESAITTRAVLGSVQVPYARPGRWREVLSDDIAQAIVSALGEGVPT